MSQQEPQDFRVTRKRKGWVLEAGFLNEFIEKNIPKESHVVDIGCGPGHWLLYLHENGYKNIHGVDLDDYLVFDEIKKLGVHRKVDLTHQNLPFEDNSVDVILCMQVFEHLENAFHFERECRRVLKPGGLLIFSYPYGWSIQSRLKFLFKGNVIGYRMENSHINFLTKDIFAKCFLKDFRIIREEYYRGRVGILGKAVHLPANRYFGNAVCYFMEKKYNR